MRVIFAGLLFAATLSAADREFRDVVDSMSIRFHKRPMHIPMFGLVNFVTFVARPAGTRHIDLAVFEDIDWWDRDGRKISESIRDSVGGSWKPFVQTRSADEVVMLYLRPEGNDCRLLVVSVERHEAVVVGLQLNPE